MPMIGQAIPEGTYQTYHQNEIQSVTLQSYRGRWVVLVFYLGGFTFICPTELEDLGMLYPEFQKMTLKPASTWSGRFNRDEEVIRGDLMDSLSKRGCGRLSGFLCCVMLMACMGCVPKETLNALSQNTGEPGSTIPRSHAPYYANSAGNIVAPPGNPAGNPAGSPPIINGTENSSDGWPSGR